MQTTLNVGGLSCSRCKNAVKQAILAINGVTDVVVDLSAKWVVVFHDETVTVDSIKVGIEKQGYTVV